MDVSTELSWYAWSFSKSLVRFLLLVQRQASKNIRVVESPGIGDRVVPIALVARWVHHLDNAVYDAWNVQGNDLSTPCFFNFSGIPGDIRQQCWNPAGKIRLHFARISV